MMNEDADVVEFDDQLASNLLERIGAYAEIDEDSDNERSFLFSLLTSSSVVVDSIRNFTNYRDDEPLLNFGSSSTEAFQTTTVSTAAEAVYGAPRGEEDEKNDDECCECEVCCEKISKKIEIKCPKCCFKACFNCVERYYLESKDTIFITCMKQECKCVWPIEFVGSNSKTKGGKMLRNLLRKITNKRMRDKAFLREKLLIPYTTDIANVVRSRRLIVESLIQIRCENTMKASNINAKRLKGETNFEDASLDEDGFVEDDIEKIINSHIGKPMRTLLSFDEEEEEEEEEGGQNNNGGGVLKEKIHSLFEKVLQGDPLSSECKSALQKISFVCGYLSKNLFSAKVVEPLGKNELLIKDDDEDFLTRKLNQKQKLFIERSNNSHCLHRFISDIPRDTWFSIGANDVLETLFECIRLGLYDSAVYDRKIVRRIAFSIREKNGSVNAFDDMILSSGKISVQPCYQCRGHMFKTGCIVVEAEAETNSSEIIKTILECKLCKSIACFKCREAIRNEKNIIKTHECKQDNILSVKEIETTTKPCPCCAAPITRAEGCRHMFCSRCKHPYDWETLKLLTTTNTNPDYHMWLEEIRRSNYYREDGGAVSSSPLVAAAAAAAAAVLSRDTIGEDGMTRIGRMNALYNIYERNGFTMLSTLVIFLFNLERKFIRKAFDKIPKNFDFETLRIKFLNHDITEKYWYKQIGILEIASFVLNKIIFLLDRFLHDSLEETKKAFRSFEELEGEEEEEGGRNVVISKKKLEIEALKEIIKLSCVVNDEFGSIVSILDDDDDSAFFNETTSSFFFISPSFVSLSSSSSESLSSETFLASAGNNYILGMTSFATRPFERRMILKLFDFLPFEKVNSIIFRMGG